MKTIYRIPLAASLIILAFIGFSCKTLSTVADVGFQAAGAAGIIDENLASAGSKTAQAWGNAAEEITPEQEYYIGRAVGANILSSYKIWNGSPHLLAYANRICNALVINSPRPEIYNGYHVMILDSHEINAFATPGGHIFITRGIITSANSEDALAAVIAHEIAHIQLQHSVKAIKNSRVTQALMVTGTSAAGAASGYDVNQLTEIFNESVGEIVSTMVNNGYSQSQEFDADNTALSLLTSAGYNPSALLDVLKTLDSIQSARPGGFNKTHPAPSQRIANALKSLPRYNVADTAAYRRARYSAAMK
ncbi:MAG: M48 family metalloprotease [Treponema sp.]|jgi:predicted Zn-dependent protease|nr:M48 family metalloprotease [Treponema sp.]